MKKHSFMIMGHATSLSLEDEFWEALRQIAIEKQCTMSALVAQVDATRQGNLSGALRVFILQELQKQIKR